MGEKLLAILSIDYVNNIRNWCENGRDVLNQSLCWLGGKLLKKKEEKMRPGRARGGSKKKKSTVRVVVLAVGKAKNQKQLAVCATVSRFTGFVF